MNFDTLNKTPRRSSEILREILLSRKERNPLYSARAFARDIGMSQTLLSQIMSGQRPLTLAQAMKITASLESSKGAMEDADELLEMAISSLPAGAKMLKKLGKSQEIKQEIHFIDFEIARLKVISQWYHLPILDLSTTKDFQSDPNWIAKRLKITPVEARDAMERLLMVGLAVEINGQFKKSHSKIHFPTKSSEAAVRSYHKQMIGKSLEQLNQTDSDAFASREISGMTVAVSKEKINEARKKIQAFQDELLAFMTAGESCDEVYQFNVQLFPLTTNLND